MGRLRKDPPGVGNNFTAFDFWVNPDFADENTPTGTASGAGTITSYEYFGLRSVNLSAGDVVTIDGFAVADNWGDAFYGGENPLLVTLESFDAVPDPVTGLVTLRWVTSMESNNAGFHIYRGEQGGARYNGYSMGARLTDSMLPGFGDTFEPQTYEWTDPDPLGPGETRSYFLEDVDFNGTRTVHGPATTAAVTSAAVDWHQYE